MRELIRSELAAIEPFDVLEHDHLADALAWVDSGAEIFRTAKPATPPKHLVSYFVVVDADWILLVDHKNARLWLPTGGHVEMNEHPRATVVRELEEELGLRAEHAIGAPLMRIRAVMAVLFTARLLANARARCRNCQPAKPSSGRPPSQRPGRAGSHAHRSQPSMA
ncbi:MAG TPA: NUDIX domain-containing protein [Polyangiales bacterium]|nr:NUDIX domain-containing protein [Polyangiales bacterium]